MKTFIISEIGINHNGSIDLAKKMIDVSVEAGADANFKKRDIQSVYTEEFLNSHRESPWGATQRDQKNGLEFNEKEYKIIDQYCKEKNLLVCLLARDLKSLNFLKVLIVNLIKLPQQ